MGLGFVGHRTGHKAVAQLVHATTLCPVVCPTNSSPNKWYLMMPLVLAERGMESCPVAPSPEGGFEGQPGEYINLGGRGSQQQAGPQAPCPALISSPALKDCCSLISATLLRQQPLSRAPRASHALTITRHHAWAAVSPKSCPPPPGSPK